MKVDPINIILENNFEINKNFILFQETNYLMQKKKDLIMCKIFKSGDYNLEKTKSISVKDFNAVHYKHKLYLIVSW